MTPLFRMPSSKFRMLASASASVLLIAGAAAKAAPLSEHAASTQTLGAGGVSAASAASAGLPLTVANPSQVAVQQAQTTANLAAAATRLQAALQAQAAARSVAQAAGDAGVPNGLTAGGLQVDPRAIDPTQPGYNPLYWIGAQQPTQTASGSQTTVSINQTQAQAILNWRTFNVGSNTTVNFVQKDGTGADQSTWVAVNKVNDPTLNPSKILGQITALGSVYILNRNGVMFGGTAQVNVHALAAVAADYGASSLDNDPQSFQTAFTANGLYSPVTNTTANSSSGFVYAPIFVNTGGAVTVAPGAQIAAAAPTTVTNGGGFVLLAGASVSNAGEINTPAGQTALVAGDNIYVRPGYSPGDSTGSIANNNTVSTTRGNEVGYNVTAGSGAGQVSNTGLIQATTGDITLAGQAVTQGGVAYSTTSVAQRGTIHLLSNQDDPTSSVILAADSLTTIQPDMSGATALDSQRAALIAASKPIGVSPYRFAPTQDGSQALNQFDDFGLLTDNLSQSRIEVTTGGAVDFKGGSLTMTQGGQIAVSAVNRALVETGANLDVSGSIYALLPAMANVLSVNIQGNELRDAPVDRDSGELFNDNFYVNVRSLTLVPAGTDGYPTDRYYTAGGLVEASGWLANVGHTIGEWTAEGGAVTLSTGVSTVVTPFTSIEFPNGTPVDAASLAGSIVVQPGAIFNLSGGAVSYQGGYVPTTTLKATNGQIYNIDNAPANLTYTGLANSFQVDHTRWVVTQFYASGLMGGEVYEPGYVVGKDAGQLYLDAPTVLFEGQIEAGVVAGDNQVAARPAGVTDGYLLTQNVVPLAGGLVVQTNLNTFADGNSNFGQPGDIRFTSNAPAVAGAVTATSALPDDRVDTAWFDAASVDSFDLGNLTVQASNPLTLDAPLTLSAGGQLNLTALSVDIAANVTVRGGVVNITTTPNIRDPAFGVINNRAIDITLEPGVAIDTRGLFTNERFDPLSRISQAYIQGGSVSLSAINGIDLRAGSVIDASGGGYVSQAGASTIGNGGNIALLADQFDASGGGGSGTGTTSLGNVQATLTLDGTLRSYGAKGGTLTLSFPQDLIIGDGVSLNGNVLPAGEAAPGNLELTQELTIPAGQSLPLPYNQTTSTPQFIAPGTALTSTFTILDGMVISGPWLNPTFGGLQVSTNGGPTHWYYYGQTIPGNSVVTNADRTTLPAGYVIPASAFPQGLPNGDVVTAVTIPAGSTYASNVTYPVGTVIPIGSVFKTDEAIGSVLTLPTAFFQQGFSNYALTSFGNVAIRPGAQVSLVEPTYQATAQTKFAASGSDPSQAFAPTLTPLYLVNPTSGAITQRPGVSLSITTPSNIGASTSIVSYTGSYTPGTVLTADLPGNVTLVTQQPFTVGLLESGGLYALSPGSHNGQTYYAVGTTIPAGSVITTMDFATFGAGETLPVSVFGAAPILTGRNVNSIPRTVTMTVGAGAAITVDPLQSITLSSPGQITIDGALTAHSGSVSVLNTASIEDTLDTHAQDVTLSGLSIWLGSDSRIDTSAVAFTGVTDLGRTVGVVPNGGAILVGNQGTVAAPNFPMASTPAFVVVRPGAVLDADGTSAAIDLSPTQAGSGSGPIDLSQNRGAAPLTQVASNGGSISLNSFDGIFIDGLLTARAGGPGAAGGTLNFAIPATIYGTDTQNGPNPNVPLSMQLPRYLKISQDTTQSLEDGAVAGTPDVGLMVGQAKLSVQQIQAGGFDSLTLTGGNGLNFDGDVDLTVRQSLTLIETFNGGFSETTDGAKVLLQAPYVKLAGNIQLTGPKDFQYTPAGETGAGAKADLTIVAGGPDGAPGSGLMDLSDNLNFDPSFDTVELTSLGDMRFATSMIFVSTNSNALGTGGLGTGKGDLILTAQRLYGLPDSAAQIFVKGDLKIEPIGDPLSQATPDTFFGSLSFVASSLEQGGALFAPASSISLATYDLTLEANSLTSVSAAGLLLPYGGSVDGLTYMVNNNSINSATGQPSITLLGGSYQGGPEGSLTVDSGAVIDVSGGGEFQGKAFISGRGGSVDALVAPLLTVSGGTYNTHSSNQVFAIIPGWTQAYSPAGGFTNDGTPDPAPAIGSQITIPAGVPGLPAGRYTLLPSEYALLPGGFRVEMQGAAKSILSAPAVQPDGSYVLDAVQSVANTGIVNSAPTVVQIASGDTLRSYSQYATTTLSQAQATSNTQLAADTIANQNILIQPSLANAGNITLALPSGGTFEYAGTTRFNTGPGGAPGMVSLNSETPVEITGPAGQQETGKVAVFPATSLSAMGAPILSLATDGTFFNQYSFTVDSGAVLSGDVIAILSPGAPLIVQTGAKILATSEIALMAPDTNYSCAENGGCNNGPPPGSLILQPGSTVVSQGSLLLSGTNLTIDPAAILGAQSLNLESTNINIGSAQALAANASVLPGGLALTQERLTQFLNGDPANGIPVLRNLVLTTPNAINLVGSIDLDSSVSGGGLQTLEFDTPALYGLGSASDITRIVAHELIWDGYYAGGGLAPGFVAPPGIFPNYPGTGAGTLNIVTDQIVLGSATPGVAFYPQISYLPPQINLRGGIQQLAVPAPRQITGFANVNLQANDDISGNGQGSLTVNQNDGSPVEVSLITPQLTGAAGSVISYVVGGDLTITSPAGMAPNALPALNSLGGEIEVSANTINVDSAIVLNTGKLTLAATGDIALSPRSRLNLSGAGTVFFDAVEYSWGGDVTLSSANGDILQAPGSIIDVSAVDNSAGTITVQAVGASGQVALGGTLLGGATSLAGAPPYEGGQITVDAQSLNANASTLTADFDTLNASLDTGGFTGARLFDLKQGDLTIDKTVKASDVEVSVDNGSLMVTGVVDASGAKPGIIRLAAQNDLTLAPGGLLDAHSTVLKVDSYGNPVDAENSAYVELTAVTGMLTLSPGATIDMRVTDPRNVDANGNQIVNYGDLELNASRTGETSGDINVSAPLDSSGHGVAILGAGTIALNGYWKYSPTDPNGTIVQDNGGSTPVAANLAAITTTTLENVSTETTITQDVLSTTTTVETVAGGPAYPTTTSVTFTSLPSPNSAAGTFVSGSFFYFPGYCGAYCSNATVIAGEIVDNAHGHTFSPSNHGGAIGYFTGGGAGTYIAPGTEIMVTNDGNGNVVPPGTVLFTGAGITIQNSLPSTIQVLSTTTGAPPQGTAPGTVTSSVTNPDSSQTVTIAVTFVASATRLSDTTASVPVGTQTGTSTSTVFNPDGSITVTTNITTEQDTPVSRTTTSVADGTPTGTTTTNQVTPNGALVTTTDVGANAQAGFVGVNQIDTQNQAFINAAVGNATLMNKIGGLTTYRDSFHLRPGVEIDSATPLGDLTVSGDLDFSGFRYASLNPHSQLDPNNHGSGEPGALVLRAGGNLNVNGSINDGFSAPPNSPDYRLLAGPTLLQSGVALPTAITIGALPTPTGNETIANGYFYFPEGAKPTITAGEVDTPLGTYGPGQQLWYFSLGTVFQAGTILSFPSAASGTSELVGASTPQQAPIWALSPMLQQGDLSWSMRLTSGADLRAADTRVVQAKSVLDATGAPAYVSPIFTSTVTLDSGVPLASTVVFKGVPTSDVAGTETGFFHFYFPGYCGQNCSDVTVTAGQVSVAGHTWNVGDQIGYFNPAYGGATFAAGTVLTLSGASSGTPILTGVSTVGGSAIPAVQTKGNIILNDPHAGYTFLSPYGNQTAEVFSVIRTGTGNLELNAGEDYVEKTPFGVYTAGTQSAPVGHDVANPLLQLAQAVVYLQNNVPIAASETFSSLPPPDASLGQSSRFGIFYFGYGANEPTIVSGEVISNGHVYTVGDQLPSFDRGAVFEAGTMLTFPSLAQGAVVLGKPAYPTLANGPAQVNEFNLPLAPAQILGGYGIDSSPTVLGDQFANYESTLAGYQAYYPEHGGNLRVAAQGNISETPFSSDVSATGVFGLQHPDAVGNWLLRQGGDTTDQATAWWINFGMYVDPSGLGPALMGFQGFGTMGGGNVTLVAGGGINYLDAAVGSTGRVTNVTTAGQVVTGGTVVETGGGDLSVTAGGDVSGAVVDVRGDVSLRSSTIGDTESYVESGNNPQFTATRPNPKGGQPYDYLDSSLAPAGLAVVQGDSVAVLQARGTTFISGEADAGLAPNTMFYSPSTVLTGADAGQTGLGRAWFSLYTPNTSLSIMAAGGDLTPAYGNGFISDDNVQPLSQARLTNGDFSQDLTYLTPPNMKVVAETGSIIVEGQFAYGGGEGNNITLEAAPSTKGDVEYIAGTNIQGLGLFDYALSSNEYPSTIIGISGANAGPNDLPNPFRSTVALATDVGAPLDSLFAFEPDAPTSYTHANDSTPFILYAKTGDIESISVNDMAKFAQVEAGRNITYLLGQLTNANPGDVSIVAAGNTILYPDLAIGGPGTLSVEAGADVFMGIAPDKGYIFANNPLFGYVTDQGISTFTSTGLWFGQNGSVSGGAGISIVSGLNANPMNYAALAALYLNPANQADPAFPLDFPQNSGKVVQTYQGQLYSWLQTTYGYAGTQANQMAFFNALLPEQQDVFLRQIYFNELDQGDIEFNDPLSPLYKSYVRGRTAIATLFPSDASVSAGLTPAPATPTGSLIMYGGSGVRTDFGGTIDLMTPGGPATIGVEGATPPSTAGVITQGAGDVNIYALDSVELGQSRIFTTFGGAITIWSADGDINAGRGAKTTVVYSPPLLTYDDLGDYTLSPTVPTQGAGIATLAPIPEVPPGNVYLVAPFGTIDAGEAGIRVSGNAYLAAAHIVNAANIQVTGQTFGLPPKPTTNLTLATTDAATKEAINVIQQVARRPSAESIVMVEVIGFGGDDSSCASPATRTAECPR